MLTFALDAEDVVPPVLEPVAITLLLDAVFELAPLELVPLDPEVMEPLAAEPPDVVVALVPEAPLAPLLPLPLEDASAEETALASVAAPLMAPAAPAALPKPLYVWR